MDWLAGPLGRGGDSTLHHQERRYHDGSSRENEISKPVASQLFKRMEKNQLYLDIAGSSR